MNSEDRTAGELTPAEMMTIAAARLLVDTRVCFVGIGIPSQAANLAKRYHAPDITLVYESGTIGVSPEILPLSIGDEELATTAQALVPMGELFSCWLQAGRIDVGFLGAAQVDRYGNLNSTVIGDYARPEVRLPGAGGAPDIAAFAKSTLVMIRHEKTKLVPKLDFTTSLGYLDGYGARERAGLSGGPQAIVTDLAILRPESRSQEFVVDRLFPGVSRKQIQDATGWEIRFAEHCREIEPPSPEELRCWTRLRDETVEARRRPSAVLFGPPSHRG